MQVLHAGLPSEIKRVSNIKIGIIHLTAITSSGIVISASFFVPNALRRKSDKDICRTNLSCMQHREGQYRFLQINFLHQSAIVLNLWTKKKKKELNRRLSQVLTFKGIQREHLHHSEKGWFLGKQEVAKRKRKLELIFPLRCFKCLALLKLAVFSTRQSWQSSTDFTLVFTFCLFHLNHACTICYPVITGCSTPKGRKCLLNQRSVGFGSALLLWWYWFGDIFENLFKTERHR